MEDGFNRMDLGGMDLVGKMAEKRRAKGRERERYFLFPSLIPLSDSLISLPRSFWVKKGWGITF